MKAREEPDLGNVFADETDCDVSFDQRAQFKPARGFLASLWGSDDEGNLSKVHFIAEKAPRGMIHHPVTTVGAGLNIATKISAAGRDAYFACAAFETDADRTAGNAAGAQCLWFDIDCGPDKAAKNEGYGTKREAIIALRDCCLSVGLPEPSIMVDSGNGFHCYWYFTSFISAGPWHKMASKLKKLAAKSGLLTDPQRTADIASVLRVPGTMNFKDPLNPKKVTILYCGPAADLSTFAAVLDRQQPDLELESNLLPRQNDSRFPPSSALEIIKQCPTLAYIAQVRGAVNEPLWREMLGVVKYTTEGEPLGHEWSMGDPRYDRNETQLKIDSWTAGPTLCTTFQASHDAKCAGCAQTCRSPIQLGWSKDLNEVKDALHELNLRYLVARVGGGVFVFDQQDKNILGGGMSFTAFMQFKATMRGGGTDIAKLWLYSAQRPTYNSLVFDPTGKHTDGSFNMWRGLTIEPERGVCRMILRHIQNVWCNGDIAQFKYVLRWMALLVQRPWIKPEVALVLRAKEGTGKNVIVKLLLNMFGVHGYVTAQKDQVAGRFNGHLFDKVLVVLNEAFFAGDPAAVAAAKALITDSPIGYEAKGKDAFSAPNYAHVISLTNNEWAVPAGEDSRRWMVLDVSIGRKGDYAYFVALIDEIECGGAEAFLYLLMKINLDGYKPRVLPATKALHTQRIETLERSDPVASFLLHALSDGAFTIKEGAVDWGIEISAVEMQESYVLATVRAKNAPPFNVAAKRLRKLLPPGSLTKIRKWGNGSRFFNYQLPDLQVARQHFETVTGVDPCAV